MRFQVLLSSLFLTLAVLPSAQAVTYEASLPEKLFADPDLCAYAPCRDVIDADRFSLRKGQPRYVEAYRTDGQTKRLVGYVFVSTDVVDIPGYSGQPMVTLIGMDRRGIITGIRILKHTESALHVGIPESELTRFAQQYVGKFVGDKIVIGKARERPGTASIDAISGATVTAVAENQTISRSAYEIANQVGILQVKARPAAKFAEPTARHDWRTLINEGSVGRLSVSGSEVDADSRGEPYIDMHFGYLNAPSIGISILGEENYQRLMARLKPDEHAIFIIASGVASFKGSGYARGGLYERIRVAQGLDTFVFRDTDYLPLYRVVAAGAPAYRESGIFIIRGSSFSAAYPWTLEFLANRLDKETGRKTFINFERDYSVPAKYMSD